MRERLNPDEIAERENDPTALTRFFYRRAWVAGTLSGLLVATWIRVLGLDWRFAVGTGVAMFVYTGFMWRPGGPGQRWRRYMLRRFPKK